VAGAQAARKMSAFRTLGVIGAGQMGAGIAQVAAACGLNTLLKDSTYDAALAGLARIQKQLQRAVEKGRMSEDTRIETLNRIHVCTDLEEFKAVDIAIEAVPEDEALKKQVLKQLEQVLRRRAIIASNTSSISITRLGSAAQFPSRVVGMHFMQPVPVMQLVELIRGHSTSPEVFNATKELAERYRKLEARALVELHLLLV